MIFDLGFECGIWLGIAKEEDVTRLAGVDRGNLESKRLCSRSRNFGILSNGMFPHFLISQRFRYVANEHTNARLNEPRQIHGNSTNVFSPYSLLFFILFQSSIFGL